MKEVCFGLAVIIAYGRFGMCRIGKRYISYHQMTKSESSTGIFTRIAAFFEFIQNGFLNLCLPCVWMHKLICYA